MPRVLWFSVQLLCLLFDCLWWNRYVNADCWYNIARYREGQEVATAEPCLNCTCSKATLVCYLRVCPKLPNPPPPGCILLYKYRVCCPELICHDAPIPAYYIEGRSETDDIDLIDRRYIDNGNVIRLYSRIACIVNGTIYAPGSAMDSSTFCEYCYCLGGKQRCVKPKCLLPVEGCTPVYSPNSCCPVQYNCTESYVRTSTTTTSPEFLQDSCLVAGKIYPKGHKILGVGHSACDNCYCIRGLVRCEPLSCAPPLLGCLPVIRSGECCAASYNCSGTIETRPEPNYGNFPIVSKEYAKFRKEATGDKRSSSSAMGNSIPTTKAHRISGYYGTTRHFAGDVLDRSTIKPYVKAKSTTAYPEIPLGYEGDKKEVENKKISNGKMKNNLFPLVDVKPSDLIRTRINIKVDKDLEASSTFSNEFTDSTTEYTTLETSTTESSNQSNPTENEVTMLASTIFDFFTQELFKDASEEEVGEDSTTDGSTTTETTTSYNFDPITLKTVINSTDCIEDVQSASTTPLEKDFSNGTAHEGDPKNANASVKDDVTVVNLESKVKVSTVTIRPIEKLPPSILSFNKDKEDYDYDIRPTLPPSLPNLKIIPFLPSDALDAKKKLEEKKRYPLLDERVTDANTYTFTNLFSPPIETEGGFVPKEPPLLDNFYDNYHTTAIEANAVTAITVSPITKSNEAKEDSCLSEGLEIRHGDAVTSKNVCVVCVCYYGDIVCQDPQCTPPKKGCRESSILDRTTCCPRIVCGDEDPQNLILDHLEITSNPKDLITAVDGIVSQDPFKDVIRTEPAPNLQTSAIEESTTKKPSPTRSEDLSLDKVLQLLFANGGNDDKAATTSKTTLATSTEPSNKNTTKESTQNYVVENVVKGGDTGGVGPLKLAGCNIYGRMYRVGRIISELSGPCLECKCTEIGVQCKKLC